VQVPAVVAVFPAIAPHLPAFVPHALVIALAAFPPELPTVAP